MADPAVASARADAAALTVQMHKRARLNMLENETPDDWATEAISDLQATTGKFDPNAADARDTLLAKYKEVRTRHKKEAAALKIAFSELEARGGDIRPADVFPTPKEAAMMQPPTLEKPGVGVRVALPKEPYSNYPVSRETLEAYDASAAVGNARRAQAEKDVSDFKRDVVGLGLTPDQLKTFSLGGTIKLEPLQHHAALRSKGRILQEMAATGQVGPPSKFGFNREGPVGSVVNSVMYGLGAPSRALSAAKAGAIAELNELTKDVPLEESEASPVGTALGKAVKWGALPTAMLMAGPIGGYVAADAVGASVAGLADKNARMAGVPIRAAANKLMENPKNIGEIGKAMALYAKLSLMAEDPIAPTDYMAALQNAAGRYMERAALKAKSEVAPPPDESDPNFATWQKTFTDAAEKHYKNLLRSDVEMVDNPALATFIQETLTDPLNVATPNAFLKAGWAAIKTSPRLETAVRRVGVGLATKTQDVQSLFRHPSMVRTSPMNVASEGMSDAASIVRMVDAEAVGKVERPLREMYNDPRRGLFAKFSEAENASLFDLYDTKTPVEAIPDKYKEAYQYVVDLYGLGGAREKVRDLSAAGQRFADETDVLLKTSKWENYAPWLVQKPRPGAGSVLEGGPTRTALTPNIAPSAYERSATSDPVKNLGVQIEADLQQSIKKFPEDYRMKRLNDLLGVNVSNELTAGLRPAEILEGTLPSTAMMTVPNVEPTLARVGREVQRSTKGIAKLTGLPVEELAQTQNIAALDVGKLNPDRQFLLRPAKDLASELKPKMQELTLKSTAGDINAKTELEGLKLKIDQKVSFDKLSKKVSEGRLEFAEVARVKGDIEEMRVLLKKQTNLDWEILPGELDEAVQVHTGEPGATIRGQEALLVPAPMKRVLLDAHIVLGDKSAYDQTYRAVQEFNRRTFYHLHRIWRTNKTTIMPGFAPVNGMSVPMLSFAAKGITGLNPRIHGNAALAAFMAAGIGSERARAVPFRLVGGKEKITLGRLVDIAHDVAIDQQLTQRLADIDTLASGVAPSLGMKIAGAPFKIPALAAGGLELVTRKTGLYAAANITENYQHMAGLALFLETDTPLGIARALDKHNQFFGNYRLLSKPERLIASSGAVGFYPWARFIFPSQMKNLALEPGRYAPFARGPRLAEATWGGQSPARGMEPPWLQAQGAFTAPPDEQPLSLRKQIEHEGGIQPPGSHQYGMQVIRSPLNMMLPYLSMIMKSAGVDVDLDQNRGDLRDLLGWAASIAFSAIDKTDLRDGSPTPDFFGKPKWPEEGISGLKDVGLGPEFGHSIVGKSLYGFIDRPTEALCNGYKLYFEDGRKAEAMEYWLRAYAGRTYGWLGNKALGILSGKGDMSVGGMLDPIYSVDPSRRLGTIQRESTQQFLERAGSLKK